MTTVEKPKVTRQFKTRERIPYLPVTVNFILPELERLEAAANEAGVSRSEAVRRGIALWLAQQGQ